MTSPLTNGLGFKASWVAVWSDADGRCGARVAPTTGTLYWTEFSTNKDKRPGGS